MSKILSKINQNFIWFFSKLFNLDEKVIWVYLTLIAKNKFYEKGTLSIIYIGVNGAIKFYLTWLDLSHP